MAMQYECLQVPPDGRIYNEWAHDGGQDVDILYAACMYGWPGGMEYSGESKKHLECAGYWHRGLQFLHLAPLYDDLAVVWRHALFDALYLQLP